MDTGVWAAPNGFGAGICVGVFGRFRHRPLAAVRGNQIGQENTWIESLAEVFTRI